jgi:hypothetical protein
MRIGVTGHQRLENPSSWDWVRREMNALLRSLPRPLVGITCLAIGADQLFADAVLQNDGTIEVMIPFPEYETSFDEPGKFEYRRLLDRASKVTVLQRKTSVEKSYFEAGKRLVDSSELIVGVWNGNPSAGLGGTADIMRYAIEKKTRTVHINPINHTVIQLYTGN